MLMPADADAHTSVPLLLCGVGLLLTVIELNGFGFDVADDTVGFGLVCIGATRLPATAGRPWARLTAVSAGLAALVSVFTYGGPAGQVVPMTYRLWTATTYLDAATTAGVVTGLLLVVRTQARSTSGGEPWPVRALPFVAATYLVAAALSAPLVASPSAYSGPLGDLRQAVAVIVGGIQGLAVVAVLLAARTGTADR